MTNLKSVDEILDFAIGKEEEAAAFYTDLAGRVDKPWMKKVFEEFANEEKGHKAKLQAVKRGKQLVPAAKKVLDLKLADYLIDGEITADIDYQEALIVAMKAEKSAYKLYTNLADTTDDENLRNTFLALAQEEAKHKLRFEIEYDDRMLEGN